MAYLVASISINRNIVECKDQCGADEVFKIIRINRNIVECKGQKSRENATTGKVLIETLWNVKFHVSIYRIFQSAY